MGFLEWQMINGVFQILPEALNNRPIVIRFFCLRRTFSLKMRKDLNLLVIHKNNAVSRSLGF